MTDLVRLRSGEADVARKALERCVAGGGVAVFPSDGLYGLACDPLDAGAIAKIHRLKGRDDGMPSTVIDIAAIDEDGSWRILRDGAVSPGDVASALASVGLD